MAPVVDLHSDVTDVRASPSDSAAPAVFIRFPLAGGPFLCTQGAGGHFTHYHASTFHAVDIRCPGAHACAHACVLGADDVAAAVGTPVLAVGDAEVVDCKQV